MRIDLTKDIRNMWDVSTTFIPAREHDGTIDFFETMVFLRNTLDEVYAERHGTLMNAALAHGRIVWQLRNGVDPNDLERLE